MLPQPLAQLCTTASFPFACFHQTSSHRQWSGGVGSAGGSSFSASVPCTVLSPWDCSRGSHTPPASAPQGAFRISAVAPGLVCPTVSSRVAQTLSSASTSWWVTPPHVYGEGNRGRASSPATAAVPRLSAWDALPHRQDRLRVRQCVHSERRASAPQGSQAPGS